MATISRRVKELSKDGQPVNPDKDRSIEDLRAIPAWVLLGEPGAGKSQTFAEEARACQGVHISVAEFLYLEAEEQWGGRILFLDGLDEIRASNDSQSILLRLRARLKKLGTPAYRIACRAADWYGTLDEDDIRPASPNGILSIFCLLPLDENDAARILQEDFEVGEPSTFIATARFHGVDGMLQNPHTLKLLAQAITANALPSTREEVFELACRSQVMEVGKRHRVQAQSPSAMPDALLDAAGQLFAVMLLSDKSGIALDSEAGDARYPSLESFQPPDINHAQTVLHRPLLVPSLSRSDCLEPSHRSVAEFLAARWLAKQIDVQGLPVGRALNLLLGFDGKTIAGLRGLYAWLALRCHAARATLNEMDPLTVVLYGDVGPMPLADKRQLLRGLLREVRQPVTLREVRSAPSVRALFDSGLEPDFLEILESTQRDDSSQVSLEVVLAVLNGAPLSSMLTDCLKTVAIDRSRWQRVRIRALQEWIDNQDSQVKVLGFLDEIRAGSISDADDELSGLLLRHLYPVALTAETLFDYLHTPQTPNLLGNYTNFWAYEFPKLATNDDLPILLDKLAMRTDLGLGGHTEFHLNGMAGELVVRAVSVHGDAISDERLFTWLSIGSNEYGENRRSRQLQEVLTKWLGERPQRYKGLLAVSYSACANSEDPLRCLFSKRHALSGATVPDDIGLWHLQQAGVVANPVLAREHMRNAVRTLMTLRGNKQLTLEKVIEWAGSDTVRNEWLQSELYCEISTMQQTWAQSQLQYNQEQAELRHKRTSYLADHLQDIADGSAPAAWLGELAGVWNNRFSNTRGETPLDRFMAYCDNYEEVYEAVNSGFRACVKRADIPSIEAIIEQYLSQKTFFISQACLVGMQLLWEDSIQEIITLSDETLARMLCFRLIGLSEKTPDWFTFLVKNRPALVTSVLLAYSSRVMAAKKDTLNDIYPLAHDYDYRGVALIAVPELLRDFPLRAKVSQLQDLDCLLKSALRYSMPELPAILESKLARKSLDATQMVYWLTTGMLMDPAVYERKLWLYVGRSSQRAQLLMGFLGNRFGEFQQEYELSAQTLGQLIELQTPHAEMEGPLGGGMVSETMRLGDQVRALITKLGGLANPQSAQEIERLLALPTLNRARPYLEMARHEMQQRMREDAFIFTSLEDVASILANARPANSPDMLALALAHLDDIALELRSSNSDLYRRFWTEGKSDNRPKSENSCRDVLLGELRHAMTKFEVECTPEADAFDDKRMDIRLSYRGKIELPIEIKGEWNDSLWSAIKDQLIQKYAIARNAQGYGIYLVLWFGEHLQPKATDGGSKPASPQELQRRLSSIIPVEYQGRIVVRVMDVSWPK